MFNVVVLTSVDNGPEISAIFRSIHSSIHITFCVFELGAIGRSLYLDNIYPFFFTGVTYMSRYNNIDKYGVPLGGVIF